MSASASIGTHDAVLPEPLWFRRDGAAAFGMLQAPAQPSTRGVIFCNALGFEGLLVHRAFRYLSEDLCERGFWSLRFDYEGEGDSAGSAWDPGRVEAWLASIDEAVGVLRTRGVTDIRLIGFRMGATLASLYATSHPGVSGLVLWAPLTKGKTYARELRALSRLAAVARPPQNVAADWFPEDALEVAAFDISGETLNAISEIDLLEAPVSVCPPAVLVIDRDDAPPNEKLVERFAEAGAHVDHERLPGYSDFMTDSEQNSRVPEVVLARVAGWLADGTATAAAGIEPATAPVAEAHVLEIDDPVAGMLAIDGPTPLRVVEQPVWIDDRFFAVVSSPTGDAPIRKTAVVLINTGFLNRTGPGRLHVNLARYWAGLGFTVVRVDIGLCGDTRESDPEAVSDMLDPGRAEDIVLAPERAEEVRDVIRWTRSFTGFDHVVAGGLCSGGYNAFQVALNGAELDDILLINPGTFYVSVGYIPVEDQVSSANALTRGFLNGRKWKLALRDPEMRRQGLRSVRKLLRDKPISGMRVMATEWIRNQGRRAGIGKHSSELARDFETIIGRGCKVYLVFSPGEFADRYFRIFGGPACQELARGDDLELVYVDGGDHVFASSGARQQLVNELTRYLDRRHPLVSDPAITAAPTDSRRVSGSRGPLGLSAL